MCNPQTRENVATDCGFETQCCQPPMPDIMSFRGIVLEEDFRECAILKLERMWLPTVALKPSEDVTKIHNGATNVSNIGNIMFV